MTDMTMTLERLREIGIEVEWDGQRHRFVTRLGDGRRRVVGSAGGLSGMLAFLRGFEAARRADWMDPEWED